ncbi:MAG: hypothetical protein JXL81_14105 [Deltaproteobacteria bacterium]|nr:hypothetical protein [Deltaproteobacteria bacterium]
MKRLLILLSAALLSLGAVHAAEDEVYDSYKGSFSMYDISAEMAVLKKIESHTDPDTEKVMIGGLVLKFEYMESELSLEKGMQVAYVHFTDKEDRYILTYHVNNNTVVKIMLFAKNNVFLNKELYPAKDTEEKKQSK